MLENLTCNNGVVSWPPSAEQNFQAPNSVLGLVASGQIPNIPLSSYTVREPALAVSTRDLLE